MTVTIGLILLMAVGVPGIAHAAGPYAYITNFIGSNVTVIDTSTDTVMTSIPVKHLPYGVVVTPDGAKTYITNTLDSAVSVIDTATNTVVTTIIVGNYPQGLAVTPDGTKAYVANMVDNTVSVIDTATNTVVATIPVGRNPLGIAVTPDGAKTYVTCTGNDTVSVIDTATNTVVTSIPSGSYPRGIAVTPDGTIAYVACSGSNTISVIDTATNTVTTTIPTGISPSGVAVTPDGTKAYAGNYGSNTVSVIDTATNTVTTTIPVGTSSIGIAVTPDGSKVYVANSDSGNISIIDTATNTVTTSIIDDNKPTAFGLFIGPPPAPVADFTGNATLVRGLEAVQFNDTSAGSGITGWNWSFGDGTGNSTVRNATHTYPANNGPDNRTYTVTLTIRYARGNSTLQKADYITVLPSAPVADFTANITEGTGPLCVQFNDASGGGVASTWQWNFGDGTGNYTTQNVTHTFPANTGPDNIKYTVTLTVGNAGGNSTKQAVGYITVRPPAPKAGFTANRTSGVAPLAVQFNDTSNGYPTSWQWDFGDVTGIISERNATHTFGNPGVYTVALTVSGAGGSNTNRQDSYITVKAPLRADFTPNVTSGPEPLTVQFTDMSAGGPSSWQWNFGDGTPNATTKNVTHTFTGMRTYNVVLTVKDSTSGQSSTANATIQVKAPLPPVADFSASPNEGMIPLTVQFYDRSTGYNITSWRWTFGDGTSSTERNPVHKYTTGNVGDYGNTVTLTVTNAGGSNMRVMQGYIQLTGLNCGALLIFPLLVVGVLAIGRVKRKGGR